MDGCVDRCVDGCEDSCVNGCVDKCVNGFVVEYSKVNPHIILYTQSSPLSLICLPPIHSITHHQNHTTCLRPFSHTTPPTPTHSHLSRTPHTYSYHPPTPPTHTTHSHTLHQPLSLPIYPTHFYTTHPHPTTHPYYTIHPHHTTHPYYTTNPHPTPTPLHTPTTHHPPSSKVLKITGWVSVPKTCSWYGLIFKSYCWNFSRPSSTYVLAPRRFEEF